MLWQTGTYKFQQIRNQNYRFVVCLGISPHDAHCWIIPKNVLMELWAKGEIKISTGVEEEATPLGLQSGRTIRQCGCLLVAVRWPTP